MSYRLGLMVLAAFAFASAAAGVFSSPPPFATSALAPVPVDAVLGFA